MPMGQVIITSASGLPLAAKPERILYITAGKISEDPSTSGSSN
jgi:hypothetical protein